MVDSFDNKPRDTLFITLLGNFRISIGGEEIHADRFRLRKARNLVKILALAPDYRLHREQLMELLWPDYDPEAAANNLHQALFAARRALDPSGDSPGQYLIYENEILSLNPDASVWVDVEAFERAAAQARRQPDPTAYQSALELYTGDLLPEDPYEEWTVNRRETLHQAYLGLLQELGRLYEAGGEYRAGIEVLQKLIQADPVNEEAHVQLMQLYALSGQRQPALRQYQALQEVLRRELDIEPEPSSTQIFKDIQSGKYPAAGQGKPVVTPSATRHNLPSPLSSFIGREQEIAQVVHELKNSRLVTLTGSGGVGKTRLSLQVAERVLELFPDGVWYVELAPVSDPDLVPHIVATALGLQDVPGRPIIDSLAYFLRDRQALLLLDNCEHLLEACARLADLLLKKAPRLKMMASSREALGIPGEIAFHVPSLAAPDPHNMPSLVEFKVYEAVRLFSERARAALPAFQVDELNAPAIAQICRRLDGIPLALELAATRLNLLTTGQLASRLDDAFRLLSGGSRTALPRQQTLRATIDWSYRLLSEGERCLLRRLAVFAGGGELEAIEEVCAGKGLASEEILEMLTGLVNKSMVSVDRTQHTETRYRLLETVRQYAGEKLNDANESAFFRDHHLDYYLELAERIEPQLRTSVGIEKLAMLKCEIDNLRAALSWAMDAGTEEKTEAGLRLASALQDFWETDFFLLEGYTWIERGLSALPVDAPAFFKTCARARFASGSLLFILGRHPETKQRLSESLEIYREIGETAGVALAQSLLGEALAWIDVTSPQAKGLCEQSLAIARTLNDPWLLAWVLCRYGGCANSQRDYALAWQLLEESLSIFEQVGDRLQVGEVFMTIGRIAYLQGDYPKARTYLKKTLVAGQAIQSNWLMGTTLGILGEVDYMQDDFEQMEVYFRLAREKHWQGGVRIPNMWLLRGLGIAIKRQGRPQEAAVCYMESLRLAQEADNPYGVYAAMAGLVGSAISLGYTTQAVRLLGAVEALFANFIKPLDPWEQREFDWDLSAVKGSLCEEVFFQTWAEGHKLPLEEALRETNALGSEIQSLNKP